MNLIDIWCEKYRPKTLDEIILSEQSRAQLDEIVKNKSIPHILLQGPPGIGKTTLAKIIVNDILKCQHLYINASDEGGIDTVRSKIVGFAKTKSIDGNIKAVILDEADGLTPEGQRALRNVTEEYSQYTRFIFTANFKHRIIAPIQSRVQEIDIEPSIKDVAKRCFDILKKENIKVSEDERLKFVDLIRKYYPDIRKTINILQKFSNSGELKIVSTENIDHIASEVYSMLKDPLSLRKYTINHEIDFQNDYQMLLKAVLEIIYKSNLKDDNKQECILAISEHLYRCAFCVDQEINFTACCIQLNKIIYK
jgi:DNA polymerase III delta prime subunit